MLEQAFQFSPPVTIVAIAVAAFLMLRWGGLLFSAYALVHLALQQWTEFAIALSFAIFLYVANAGYRFLVRVVH